MFFYEAKLDHIHYLHALFLCCKAVSGLNIFFDKSEKCIKKSAEGRNP
jgi:hypothetical protein